MKHRIGIALLALSALAALGGDPAPPIDLDAPAKDAIFPSAKDLTPSAKSASGAYLPPPPQHRWVLGAGVSWRNIGEIDFDTGVTNLTIPMVFAAGNTPVPGIGAATGFANRTYNDGFVNPDARTPGLGRTTDYGYQNPGQIQGNNLVYNATGGENRVVARTTSAAASGWSEDRDWQLSPYLKLSHLTELGNGWSAGPALHFAFTNIDGGRRGLNTVLGREQLDIFDVSATDTYDATGLILPLAPYTGAPNIAAPLLPAVPANRTLTNNLRQTDVATWNDSINESLDIDMWGISLGGEAVYQFKNKFFALVGVGVVLNIADWKAKRSDTLFQQVNNGPPVAISSNSAGKSGADLLWGLYLQAAAGYQMTKQFSVETHLRYDWNQSLADSVGNSSFDVNLSSLSLGLGGNYVFW